MRCCLFPFGHLNPNQAEEMSPWFGPLRLIVPSGTGPTELQALAENGQITFYHPDSEDQTRIDQHWRALKDWRMAHDGMAAKDLYRTASATPFYDPDHAHQIRDNIRRGTHPKVSETEADGLRNAWILLKAAFEYDLQMAEVTRCLRSTEMGHEDLFQTLQGRPSQTGKGAEVPTDQVDPGRWKPGLRLQSWARIYLSMIDSEEGDASDIFITNSPHLFDHLQPELEKGDYWHFRMGLPAIRHDDHAQIQASDLQEWVSKLSQSHTPAPEWQQFVQWASEKLPDKPHPVRLDLWMLPDVPPHEFWAALVVEDQTGSLKPGVSPASRNTLIVFWSQI